VPVEHVLSPLYRTDNFADRRSVAGRHAIGERLAKSLLGIKVARFREQKRVEALFDR
jgi:hypothetical protein